MRRSDRGRTEPGLECARTRANARRASPRGRAALALALIPILHGSGLAGEGERPTVGLVLSGGGARGAAHIGVLEVLEELRIPVDCVVGTSMGSIIGGLYAAGYSPAEMRTIVTRADWPKILSDDPPRDELWFRRRQDDRRFQVDLELGWDDGLALPPGLVLGLNVEAFLQDLFLPVEGTASFDRLPIPFRCVATDLATGDPVVLDGGSLPRAIRASMSLPGVFAPVTRDGRMLVDGGVVDNVPVGIARAMGADVVIVVDITTPVVEPESTTMLGVTNQVLSIMMAAGKRRSLEMLRADDVLIVPELGDIGALAFDRSDETIPLGREATERSRERLETLAVDEAAWERWVSEQRRPEREGWVVRSVVVRGRTRIPDDVIQRVARLSPGDTLDGHALAGMRERLAGLGVFEHIEIDVVPTGVGRDVVVVLRPLEKSWGPQYFRFRIGAESDLRGNGEFDVGVQHTWTPLNSYGGEWRTEVEVGTRTRLSTEFYQPLDPGLRWFVVPSVQYRQDNQPIIVGGDKVAEVSIEAVDAGASVGRNLGSWGEVRAGYAWTSGTGRPEIALPGLLPSKTTLDRGQFELRLIADTLDDVSFPRSGVTATATWEVTDEAVGGDDRRSILSGQAGIPLSRGGLTLFPAIEGGTVFDGQSIGGEFFLGGFQRLSGLEPLEVSGNHFALGKLQAYYELSDHRVQRSLRTYVGGTVELGGIWLRGRDAGTDLRFAGSAFLAFDTPIGPIYLGYGITEGGESSAYVFIQPIL